MSHASHAREANLLGACSLAVADRLATSARDAALVALSGWLGGASVEALARVVALTHSGAVRLVDRLERDGLVERRAGADGRSLAVHVTAAGAAEADRLRARREAALVELLAPLDGPERRALTGALERILAGLTTGHESARRTCRLCDTEACGHPDRCPVTRAAA